MAMQMQGWQQIGNKLSFAVAVIAIPMALSGCLASMPQLGGASGNATTGAAAGGNASGQSGELEQCSESLGTIAVVEDQSAGWWRSYYRHYPTLGTTVPVLRTMIQQSNCFVVVERGRAMKNMQFERELANSGELRGGSNFGKGQMVAADYTMSPSIQFSEKGTSGVGGAISGLLGSKSRLLSMAAGSVKSNEASTTLLLIENRSGVQISAAQGNAKNFDMKLYGASYGRTFARAGGFTKTPEGKVLAASFADSYNNMVRALRNYRVQQVKGGLGKGGTLRVGD